MAVKQAYNASNKLLYSLPNTLSTFLYLMINLLERAVIK
jgi:hypothetical protein